MRFSEAKIKPRRTYEDLIGIYDVYMKFSDAFDGPRDI